MPSGTHPKKHHKQPEEDSLEPKPFESEISLSEANNSLTLPLDDVDSRANEILAKDGYILNKSEHVVKVGSKINTDYESAEEDSNAADENQDEMPETLAGKKDYVNNNTSIRDLKKQFGFSWKNMSRRLAFFGLILVIFGVVCISTLAALAINKWNETKPIDDILSQRQENSVVYARDGKTKIFEVYKDVKREYVNINDIPEQMQLAIIALEDENFYYSEVGIPWKNLVGAVSKCILSIGDECRGGSGLSQQLVKNVTGKTKQDDRTLDNKIDELFTALKLSNGGKTKAEILELYLNTVPFGGVTYGVQAASKNYFGKDIKDVTPVEACFLASLVQKPSSFSSSIGQPESDNWKEFNSRKNTCLEYMHIKPLRGDGKEVFIKTDEELKAFQNTPVVAAKNDNEIAAGRKSNAVVFVPNISRDEFPHFRDFVLDELKKFIPREQDLYTKGYQIITTLDPDKQRSIEGILKASEQENVINNGGNNAASVVLDGQSGEILSMVGSLGYDRTDIDGQVNIMTSPQQPGSSIKPYVYSSAFNKGFNPSTIVIDTSTEFQPGYRPTNFDRTTQGPISMRNALQNSLNIPTIKTACLSAISGKLDCGEGINQVFDFAESAGLRFACYPPVDNFSKKDKSGQYINQCDDPDLSKEAYRDRCGLASAVGGCEVIPISHATGINTLLHEGNLRTATPFISIKDNTGKELYTPQAKQAVYPSQDKAIDPLVAKQITNVLTDYDARRPKFGSTAKNLEVSECGNGAKIGGAAAKTGTTNDVKDTWTVGGCTNYTTVVWVGRTDNQSMKQNSTSSSAAAPVWNKIMKYLESGQKPPAFSTDGLLRLNVDPASGALGGGGSEWFTPAQKKFLEDAGVKIANADYVATTKNIYDFRSAVISQDISINRLDGKLATAQTLPENIEKKTCLQLIPEFPEAKNWADPVFGLYSSSRIAERYCQAPTQQSGQDQVGERSKQPLLETNLNSGTTSVNKITLKAAPQGQDIKTITKLEILIDGSVVASANNTNYTEYDVTSWSVGPHSVIVRATDSLGFSIGQSYDSVTFGGGSSSLSIADVNNLNCDLATTASHLTQCSFTLSNGKSLPTGSTVQIENAAEAACFANTNIVSCNNVQTPQTAGQYNVRLDFGQGYQNTGKQIRVI